MRSKRNYHKQKVSVNLKNQEFKNQGNLKINQQINNYYRLILCKKIIHLIIKVWIQSF